MSLLGTITKATTNAPAIEAEAAAAARANTADMANTMENAIETAPPTVRPDVNENGVVVEPGDARTRAPGLNFDYMMPELTGAPEDADKIFQIMETTADNFDPMIQKYRRGIRTNRETVEAAGNALSLEQLLGRKPGDMLNAEQATAARVMLQDSVDNVLAAAKVIKGGNSTPADKLRFEQMIQMNAAIHAQVSGMTAEAGRLLQAFQIPVYKGMVNTRDISTLLEKNNGVSPEMLADMITSFQDNPEKLARFVRDIPKASKGDMLIEYYINNLLWNPATHVVNMVSNTMVGAMSVMDRAVAGLINRGTVNSSEGVQLSEAVVQAAGMASAMKEALIASARSLKSGNSSDIVSKIETQSFDPAIQAKNMMTPEQIDRMGWVATAIDTIGEGVRVPGRLLGAEDEFFKIVAYRAEIATLAYRRAKAEGLEGDDLNAAVTRMINDPPVELHNAAVAQSRYVTFTNELGPFGKKLQNVIGHKFNIPGLGDTALLRLILPYVRTPTNIMTYTASHSPLGFMRFMSKKNRDLIRSGDATAQMKMAEAATGSMLMGLGMALAESGVITGGYSGNAAVRQAEQRDGVGEYSIKIGDEYLSINRLDPIGAILAISAQAYKIAQYGDEQSTTDAVAFGMMAAGKVFASKTYFTSFAEFLDAIDSAKSMTEFKATTFGKRYLQRKAASFMPLQGLLGAIERSNDPELRDTHVGRELELDDILKLMASKVPGLSADLPPRYNLFGEVMTLEGGLGWDIVSPMYIRTARDPSSKEAKIDKEIRDNAIGIKMPSRVFYSGIKAAAIGGRDTVIMEPAEYENFVLITAKHIVDSQGRHLVDAMSEVINSPEYKAATSGPDGGKADMLTRIYHAYRQAAKNAILAKEWESPVGAGLSSLYYDDAIDIKGEFGDLRRLWLEGVVNKAKGKGVPDNQIEQFRHMMQD